MLLGSLCNYNVIRNQNNQESIHILHNHRGGRGSLICLCKIMGDGEGVGLMMTDANKFFTNLKFFINLY